MGGGKWDFMGRLCEPEHVQVSLDSHPRPFVPILQVPILWSQKNRPCPCNRRGNGQDAAWDDEGCAITTAWILNLWRRGGERLHPARSESRRCVDQRQASPPPVPRQTCCRCANMHSRQHMRSAPRENGVRSLCMAQCEAMERGFPVLLYLDVVVERGRFGGG